MNAFTSWIRKTEDWSYLGFWAVCSGSSGSLAPAMQSRVQSWLPTALSADQKNTIQHWAIWLNLSRGQPNKDWHAFCVYPSKRSDGALKLYQGRYERTQTNAIIITVIRQRHWILWPGTIEMCSLSIRKSIAGISTLAITQRRGRSVQLLQSTIW